MLPSKGYFKSLDCPCFEIGFCDRPYCLYRHNHNPRYIQSDNLNSEINTESLLFGDVSEENFIDYQQSTVQNVDYKPTPISELNKFQGSNNNDNFALETYFDEPLEDMNVSDLVFEGNITEFVSKEETKAPENVTVNDILENYHEEEKSDPTTKDNSIHSLMNISMESAKSSSIEGKIYCKGNHKGKKHKLSDEAKKSNEKEKKKKSTKIIISRLNKRDLERKQKSKCQSNFTNSKGNSHTHKSSKQSNPIRKKEKKNSEDKDSDVEFIEEYQKKCEKNAVKIKSSSKSKTHYNIEKEVLSIECEVISSEDELSSYSNKQTFNKGANDNTASSVNINSSIPVSKNINNETKLPLISIDSEINFEDVSVLRNRVERKSRYTARAVRREQKIRKRIELVTPAKRLMMLANQRNLEKTKINTKQQPSAKVQQSSTMVQQPSPVVQQPSTMVQLPSTTVKIRSVPNVQLLLQEKEKILKMIANKNYCDSSRNLKQ